MGSLGSRCCHQMQKQRPYDPRCPWWAPSETLPVALPSAMPLPTAPWVQWSDQYCRNTPELGRPWLLSRAGLRSLETAHGIVTICLSGFWWNGHLSSGSDLGHPFQYCCVVLIIIPAHSNLLLLIVPSDLRGSLQRQTSCPSQLDNSHLHSECAPGWLWVGYFWRWAGHSAPASPPRLISPSAAQTGQGISGAQTLLRLDELLTAWPNPHQPSLPQN